MIHQDFLTRGKQLVFEILAVLVNVDRPSDKQSHLDDGTCQLILIIRSLYSLLDRGKADFNVRRSQVCLTSLTERVIELHLDGISQANVRPRPLRVRHAHVSGREALKRARGEDEEIIDKEEDIGTVSCRGDVLR